MSSVGQPIGLFGGSFDPIHLGHINLATSAIDLIGLEEVRFIPVNIPVHRCSSSTNLEDRMRMLRLALQPPLVLDEIEIKRGGLSYTVDTLRLFRADYPDRSLCLLLGKDSFDQLHSWKSCNDLLSIVNVVVAGRSESIEGIPEGLKRYFEKAVSKNVNSLHSEKCGVLYFLEAPLVEVSSTMVRSNVSDNKSLEGLVPKEVAFLIKQQNLYQNG
ncbi:MAG TPA: nicotinate (nicotinamide) nucleotide adenylyltransferase [Dehalococcoidia bacterium]|nr:nicotinate (nicotinamide) nucleotide adenylyltransferase [Dehalococcoidia bacterium]